MSSARFVGFETRNGQFRISPAGRQIKGSYRLVKIRYRQVTGVLGGKGSFDFPSTSPVRNLGIGFVRAMGSRMKNFTNHSRVARLVHFTHSNPHRSVRGFARPSKWRH